MVPVRCSLSMPVLRQNGSETLERVEKKKKDCPFILFAARALCETLQFETRGSEVLSEPYIMPPI